MITPKQQTRKREKCSVEASSKMQRSGREGRMISSSEEGGIRGGNLEVVTSEPHAQRVSWTSPARKTLQAEQVRRARPLGAPSSKISQVSRGNQEQGLQSHVEGCPCSPHRINSFINSLKSPEK